ncbi:rho GTPase activating protein at 102A isoform X2 [Arctopsyche grandis]|uniref:rho GTPase activating protein at 102A isoform X2 n=1 Tax=Arctopsyche grandis TaxID=121162 RepID=UPI00406D9778
MAESTRRASSESTDNMGKPRRPRKPVKERWLLTRKTWKYMADAGRRLIPDGALNRPEDIPKIEAYFQEVCQKEPKFLLWRKSSYPGAIGFRPHRRRRDRTKGGSCRQASSADEAEEATPPPKKPPGNLVITQTSGGRFDISKLKQDFLASSSTKDPKAVLKTSAKAVEDPDQKELIDMIQKYLNVQDKPPPPPGSPGFEYQDLIDKLQQHLALVFGRQNENERIRRRTSTGLSVEGDTVQRSLLDTLSRYYSRSPNRDHVISDLLTDRKLLKKLYSDLRQTKSFRPIRSGIPASKSSSSLGQQWRGSLHHTRRDDEYDEEDDDDYEEGPWDKSNRSMIDPPPLVEVHGEGGDRYAETGIQTDPLDEEAIRSLRAELAEKRKQRLAEEEAESKDGKSDDKKSPRRRSSVDHDDVSQSVSDTIKRYLRMARKKSVDADKADRFKRINYDKNLRNIKPRGEISKPGDDDGLNKGSLTEEDWLDGFVVVQTSPAERGASSFFSQLLHGGRDKAGSGSGSVSSSPTGGGVMQKSRSSSSVVQHVSRRIWRARSKSRGPVTQTSTWLPQGSCIWTDGVGGHQVVLHPNSLFVLGEAEKRAIRQAALARLRQLNLGVSVEVPDESAAASTHKPKRRAYLLKRKALTTGFLTKDSDKDKESTGGLVFGVPLAQCAEASRTGSLQRDSRRGSRSSFTSLLDRDRDRGEESGSCESLASRDRLAGSEGELEGFEDGNLAGPRVPAIVSNCLEHIRRYGLRTLGLFRVSTSKKRVRQLREEWDCGKEGPFDGDTCPHDVATLLKEFLRDLPDPLLCRDLYHAFVQTQRIRNRRLQLEALQLLVILLPSAHQDTLHALLSFLGEVAENCDDRQESSGDSTPGNKMDSSNLATVFAPNILHCIKPGAAGKEISAERAEERIDVINVVRSLLENRDVLFHADAELRHEACLQLSTSHPLILDALLGRMLANSIRKDELDTSLGSQGGGGADSDSQGSPPSQRKVWSREQCLHQTAAMGGPNVGMSLRQRERGSREARSSSKKRWREDQRQDSSSGSSLSSTMTIITRLRGSQVINQDEQGAGVIYSSSKFSSMSNSKTRSDSIDSTSDTNDAIYSHRRRSSSSETPVITASLRLPLSLQLDDPDIPYIEDGGPGMQPSAPPRRRQRSTSGSDSSITSQPITGTLSLSHVGGSNPAGYDSAVGSSATLSSPPRNLTPSSSSAGDGGLFSSPPSWASTPPMSPTSPTDHHADYDQFHSTTARMSVPVKSYNKQTSKDAPILQKVTITSTGEIQQKKLELYKREISYQTQTSVGQKPTAKILDLPKSLSASSVALPTSSPGTGQRRIDFSGSASQAKYQEVKYTPSITSIGGAVLRSKTADFERLLRTKTDQPKSPTKVEPPAVIVDDKKKYAKRRYTDSRHQTRHIPDAETLDNADRIVDVGATQTTKLGQVYKRREIISSVQTKQK